jgi:sugar phosphate isomerase/epimerase
MFKSLNADALSIGFSLEDLPALAAANGFAGLDLEMSALLDLAERTSVQEVKDHFSAHGIRPGAWSLSAEPSADDALYEAALDILPRASALAQEIGAPWCATEIRPYSDTRDPAANLEFHIQRLRPVAQVLAAHGCRLGLEFIGPKTLRAGHAYSFISTIEGALDLAARIGTGNVGLLLDAYHWYTSHGDQADLRSLRASDIVYVHVNDAVAGREIDQQLDLERELPGTTGLIDLAGFMHAVAGTGFDGPVAVEPFSATVLAQDPAERIRLAGESLAKIWV